MDKEVYRFKVRSDGDEDDYDLKYGYKYEYLDDIAFKRRINYYIDNKLIFNPHFVTRNLKRNNGNKYFEYLLDFIIYNKKESLALINNMECSRDTETKKRFSLLKEKIESIDKLETKCNRTFNDIFQYKKILSRIKKDPSIESKILKCVKITEEDVNEACNILLNFTKDFEFPMEIDLNNDNIMGMILNKIKSVSKEKNINDVVDFNTIRVLVNLYNFVLNKIIYDFEDYKIRAYSNLLCDELYEYLLGLLKGLYTVQGSNLDYDFIDIINHCVIDLLMECNFDKLDNEEKKRLFKYYYLMVFYGNYAGFGIDSLREPFPYKVYNIFSGFEENVKLIKQNIINDLQKYSNILDYNGYFKGNSEIVDFLNKTIFKNNLLESAYYQKALLDYSPIFKGMEYTPILVNIFKMVEELSCDLFEILGLDRTLKSENGNKYIRCCYFNNQPIYFNNIYWKDKIMLGGIKNLIDYINTESFPMFLDGNDISIYHTAYNAMEINSNEQILELNEKYSSEFKCKLKFKTEQIKNSDVLKHNFGLWIGKCRNGTLHKHNVNEANKTDFCFDFTLYTINMLLEWCYILKKSIE